MKTEEAEEVALTRHKGKNPKHTVRKNSKFNYDFVKMAVRLKAAGFTDVDLAYAFDVLPDTVRDWKKRHPVFADACEKGKEAAVRYLVAQGLIAAAGYDYEVVEERFKTVVLAGEDGEKELVDVPVGKRILKKHQKSDPTLLTFMLVNLSGGEFKNTKYIETNQTNLSANFELLAELSGDEIRRVAGKFTEVAKRLDKKKKSDSKKTNENS
jgi:hypothetical protein